MPEMRVTGEEEEIKKYSPRVPAYASVAEKHEHEKGVIYG
jgi:hypothetical protein